MLFRQVDDDLLSVELDLLLKVLRQRTLAFHGRALEHRRRLEVPRTLGPEDGDRAACLDEARDVQLIVPLAADLEKEVKVGRDL